MTRMQFDDSEVASVQWRGPAVVLRFSAARLEPSAYLPGVELRMEQATIDEPATLLDLIGRVRDGHLRLHEGTLLKCLPMPFSTAYAVELSVSFANGENLRIRGSAATLSAKPGALMMDDLRC